MHTTFANMSPAGNEPALIVTTIDSLTIHLGSVLQGTPNLLVGEVKPHFDSMSITFLPSNILRVLCTRLILFVEGTNV